MDCCFGDSHELCGFGGDGKSFDIPAGARRRFYLKLDQHLATREAKKRGH